MAAAPHSVPDQISLAGGLEGARDALVKLCKANLAGWQDVDSAVVQVRRAGGAAAAWCW